MLAIFTRLAAGEGILAVARIRVPAWRRLARVLGCAVISGRWAARGIGRAGRRMVAAAGWLFRVPLLRSARRGPGTTAAELRRNGGRTRPPEPVTRPPPWGRRLPQP
jgi:hypothetical protein